MNKNIVTTFYIIRHGESEANVKEIIGGDYPLTKNGEKQAYAIAKTLLHVHFDAIFSSDLLRARQTAAIIAAERKLAVLAREELRERDYGKYDGATIAQYQREMKETYDKMKIMSEKEIFTYKRYESFETDEALMGRFLTTLRELALTYTGKNILVTSHGTLMKILLIHLGYGTTQELEGSPIKNTGYCVLECDGIDFMLKKVEGVVKKK